MNKKKVMFAVILDQHSATAKLLEGARYARLDANLGLAVFCTEVDWSTPHYICVQAAEELNTVAAHAAREYQELLLPSHSVIAVMRLYDQPHHPAGFATKT